MLLSNTHKFIFIHIWKAGGTSIRHSLSNFADGNNSLVKKHASAQEIANHVGNEVFRKYFTFSFVRNPWDIQVSNFFYIRQRPDHYAYSWMAKFGCFDEYIEWRVSEERILQLSMLCDPSGNVAVDFVGRFENFEHDFGTVCKNIGVNVKLSFRNKSLHPQYRECYTPFSRRLVEDAYEKDIEYFGYEF